MNNYNVHYFTDHTKTSTVCGCILTLNSGTKDTLCKELYDVTWLWLNNRIQREIEAYYSAGPDYGPLPKSYKLTGTIHECTYTFILSNPEPRCVQANYTFCIPAHGNGMFINSKYIQTKVLVCNRRLTPKWGNYSNTIYRTVEDIMYDSRWDALEAQIHKLLSDASEALDIAVLGFEKTMPQSYTQEMY